MARGAQPEEALGPTARGTHLPAGQGPEVYQHHRAAGRWDAGTGSPCRSARGPPSPPAYGGSGLPRGEGRWLEVRMGRSCPPGAPAPAVPLSFSRPPATSFCPFSVFNSFIGSPSRSRLSSARSLGLGQSRGRVAARWSRSEPTCPGPGTAAHALSPGTCQRDRAPFASRIWLIPGGMASPSTPAVVCVRMSFRGTDGHGVCIHSSSQGHAGPLRFLAMVSKGAATPWGEFPAGPLTSSLWDGPRGEELWVRGLLGVHLRNCQPGEASCSPPGPRPSSRPSDGRRLTRSPVLPPARRRGALVCAPGLCWPLPILLPMLGASGPLL